MPAQTPTQRLGLPVIWIKFCKTLEYYLNKYIIQEGAFSIKKQPLSQNQFFAAVPILLHKKLYTTSGLKSNSWPIIVDFSWNFWFTSFSRTLPLTRVRIQYMCVSECLQAPYHINSVYQVRCTCIFNLVYHSPLGLCWQLTWPSLKPQGPEIRIYH